MSSNLVQKNQKLKKARRLGEQMGAPALNFLNRFLVDLVYALLRGLPVGPVQVFLKQKPKFGNLQQLQYTKQYFSSNFHL
jgi:hypothetical protein